MPYSSIHLLCFFSFVLKLPLSHSHSLYLLLSLWPITVPPLLRSTSIIRQPNLDLNRTTNNLWLPTHNRLNLIVNNSIFIHTHLYMYILIYTQSQTQCCVCKITIYVFVYRWDCALSLCSFVFSLTPVSQSVLAAAIGSWTLERRLKLKNVCISISRNFFLPVLFLPPDFVICFRW